EYPAGIATRLCDSYTKNHGTNIFGCCGLKKIGTTTSTISNVVANKVGNHCRVTGIILGDVCFDLAYQVGTHVCCFCIDAASELSKEGDKTCTEAETDDEGWYFIDVIANTNTIDEE